MPKLSRDLTAGNLHPRENIVMTGALASLNAFFDIASDGCSSVSVDLRDTFNLSVQVSGTIDGTNWQVIPMRPVNLPATQYVALIVGSTQGTWVGSCAPFSKVRVQCTAFTSGSAITVLSCDNGVLDDTLQGSAGIVLGTITGAAGAATTLTLASPGAGLRHYLTGIEITRSASAALTASATPTVITTTNIPNALAFTMGINAAPQGDDKIVKGEYPRPIATTAQATATTVVCPALTGAIWRITATGFVGP